jgi:putative redox protein
MDLIRIIHQGGLCFEVRVRGHRFLVDMNKDAKGEDRGPSPAELLAASAGVCMAMHMALYCQTAGIPTAGLAVSLVPTLKEEQGRKRIEAVTVDVTPPVEVGARKAALLRAAESCIVRNTLAQGPAFDVAFTDD